MKNPILFAIIGTLVLLFSVTVIFANGSPDYKSEITKKLAESNQSYLAAKSLACEYIGNLTRSCYHKTKGACKSLDEAEKAYVSAFNNSSYNDCFEIGAEPITAETFEKSAKTFDPLPAKL